MADEIPNTMAKRSMPFCRSLQAQTASCRLNSMTVCRPASFARGFSVVRAAAPVPLGLAMIGSFYRHYRFQVREGQVRYTVLSLQRYDCCGCNAREQPKQIGPHVTVSFARCCLDPDVSGLCCYWTEWRQRRLVPARVLGQRFVSAELNLRLAEQRPILVLGRLELAH